MMKNLITTKIPSALQEKGTRNRERSFFCRDLNNRNNHMENPATKKIKIK